MRAALGAAAIVAAALSCNTLVGFDRLKEGPCPFTCGGNCVQDCAACPGALSACGPTCVSDCSACDGKKTSCFSCDFYSAHTTCVDLGPEGTCIAAGVPACACPSGEGCPTLTQACTQDLECRNCGEPLTDGRPCALGKTCSFKGQPRCE